MIFDIMISSSPFVLAASIVVSTFLLEDAAIVYAALVSASGMISPPLAFAALFIGIYSGDVGLYGLGALANRFEPARRMLGEGRIQRARCWLRRRAVATLVGARFVPGSRLPLYTASGFLRVPFVVFAITTGSASLAWCLVVFSLVYLFGAHAAEMFGEAKYIVAAVVLLALVFGPAAALRYAGRNRMAEQRHV